MIGSNKITGGAVLVLEQHAVDSDHLFGGGRIGELAADRAVGFIDCQYEGVNESKLVSPYRACVLLAGFQVAFENLWCL